MYLKKKKQSNNTLQTSKTQSKADNIQGSNKKTFKSNTKVSAKPKKNSYYDRTEWTKPKKDNFFNDYY